jgi:hypothetical protein
MFKKRYNAKANFAANVDKFFLSDGLFGNAILYVDSDDMVNIRYRHITQKRFTLRSRIKALLTTFIGYLF